MKNNIKSIITISLVLIFGIFFNSYSWGRIPKMRISHVKSIFKSTDTNGLSGFENFIKSILFMQFGFAYYYEPHLLT